VVAELALFVAVATAVEGPTIRRMDDPVAVGATATWWAAPALGLFGHRSWAGTLVSGVAFLVASAACLVTMYTSEGSTVGIGLLTIPVMRWLLAVGLALGAWAISRIREP